MYETRKICVHPSLLLIRFVVIRNLIVVPQQKDNPFATRY